MVLLAETAAEPGPLTPLLHFGITVAALLFLLVVYVAVPAVLGRLAGIRIERIVLGSGPVVLTYRGRSLEWVLRSLPLGAHPKFYGEEGVYGVRQDQWTAHAEEEEEADTRRAVDEDDEEAADDDPEEEEADPEPPPPPDSFIAAHPLVRTGVSLSGPVALLLVGVGMLAVAGSAGGEQLRLLRANELSGPVRTDLDMRPWNEVPIFSRYLALPESMIPPPGPLDAEAVAGRPAGLLPDSLRAATGSAVLLVLGWESAADYPGYIGWPLLLFQAPGMGPAFALAVFGLFASFLAALALLPVPFFPGGEALISFWEWFSGRRIAGGVLVILTIVCLVWMLLIVMMQLNKDLERVGLVG